MQCSDYTVFWLYVMLAAKDGVEMINEKRLPFPILITERTYWLKQIIRFGIHPTVEEFNEWWDDIQCVGKIVSWRTKQ